MRSIVEVNDKGVGVADTMEYVMNVALVVGSVRWVEETAVEMKAEMLAD